MRASPADDDFVYMVGGDAIRATFVDVLGYKATLKEELGQRTFKVAAEREFLLGDLS